MTSRPLAPRDMTGPHEPTSRARQTVAEVKIAYILIREILINTLNQAST
jgi:hypothetical protein